MRLIAQKRHKIKSRLNQLTQTALESFRFKYYYTTEAPII